MPWNAANRKLIGQRRSTGQGACDGDISRKRPLSAVEARENKQEIITSY
jgi:hypothetical protein